MHLNAIFVGCRSDREGNFKITFEISPQNAAKAAELALMVNRELALTVTEIE